MEPKVEISRRLGRRRKVRVETVAARNGMTPLEYMLSVMNDPNAQQTRRDRMAIYAAPYCHPKLMQSQPIGKKDQQAEAAEKAGVGTPWADDLETETRPAN